MTGPVRTLENWRGEHDPHTFPYESVLREYHSVGKHFVRDELLIMLAHARTSLTDPDSGCAALLEPFLSTALDKWDKRYNYLTYLALDLLTLPGADDRQEVPEAERSRDHLVTMLISDVVQFEHAAATGRTRFLPELRPDALTVAKRFHLGLRVINARSHRRGAGGRSPAHVPDEDAPAICEAVLQALSAQDRIVLQLSMLPVYVVHDEYLFIRVLQATEATFALIVVQLRAAVAALDAGNSATSVTLLGSARSELLQTAPLFSLLATMQVESFRRFRAFTDGASAIQSGHYKAMESICRRPDDERLNSIAYRSVPVLRARLVQGETPNIDGSLMSASRAGRLTPVEADAVVAAMSRFAGALRQWKQTHYRLAIRMLGEAPGTGYTEGTPYLKKLVDLPVFTTTQRQDRS
jgi:tryptophan 2,3-dioxygenase